MKLISIEWIAYTASVWSIYVAISSNTSQFYLENDENQFLSLVGLFFKHYENEWFWTISYSPLGWRT